MSSLEPEDDKGHLDLSRLSPKRIKANSSKFDILLYPGCLCFLAIPLLLAMSAAVAVYIWTSAPISWKSELTLIYGCALPISKHVTVVSTVRSSDNTAPYANVVIPPLVVDESYTISLELLLPNIPGNRALGNFMINLEIINPSNKTLFKTRKSVRRLIFLNLGTYTEYCSTSSYGLG